MVHLTPVKISIRLCFGVFFHLTLVWIFKAGELSLSIDVTVLQGLW